MSNTKLTLKQLDWVIEKTEIENSQEAIIYFMELMMKEGIPASKTTLVIQKMMEREKRDV